MTVLRGKDADAVLHELANGTPDTPERVETFRRADAIYRRHEVRRLASALCDSSSHINTLPHAEQRPCAYHMKRATDTLELLQRRDVAPTRPAGADAPETTPEPTLTRKDAPHAL